ncbi:GNAT family N-acetyltransferase [Allokutzneria sp. A3M-2-11 16]|uniref:GNAT family N-acetyltransferase n=1 Tax=Allokutzneria sp. A3M-2-11 16 TaxID=2962043 RepID=UPI0020B66CFA|nr:GNAT family N-acyltransferase [Allokutzneria sp. A3M-2-11 16]MCP3798129.1 GNAT family N-acetyltransferase [Allokutzneria sp. A3M-2-11 16]
MAQPSVLLSTQEHRSTYSLLVARDGDDVVAAQRLRHQVFAGEMGADLPGPLDVDPFDEICDHLLVRDDSSGEIVGTYRVLPAGRSARCYSETEFDLGALAPLRASLAETGRSCVHPDHRSGAVIGLVWAGLARYMLLTGHEWLAGCASVPLADGGASAAAVWDRVRSKHYAPEEYRVRPWNPWEADALMRSRRAEMPPLLRAYLRIGAWVCGPPAHDPEFGVADFYVLLSMRRIDQRYTRFFLGG